jgi:hypothetical protein
MTMERRLGRAVTFALRLSVAATWILAPLAAGALTVACEDESDPATWVKRLNDPAQKSASVKRLSEFFEDAMTKAGKNRNDPNVQSLLKTIVGPMAQAYTQGGLDEKTRKDLITFLADTQDPEATPAFAKALNDWENGKNDDDVRVTCGAITGMAKAGTLKDQSVIDALWSVFSKFQLSKTQSQRLYQGIHDAVLAVKDPSYGPKAIEKLNAAVPDQEKDVDGYKDQILWWQQTAVQVISEMKYAPAVKPLVTVLLTPSKLDLNATVNIALLKMAKDATPVLVSALKGADPDLKKAGSGFKDKADLAVVANALALLSLPAGRDAILSQMPGDTDTTKTAFAQALVQFPADARVEPAFLAAYKAISPNATVDLLGSLKPRPALAQAAAQLYDPGLVPWLVKEANSTTDPAGKLLPLDTALKLMDASEKGDVGDALGKAKSIIPKDTFDATQQMLQYASGALDKCGKNTSCYLAILDEPIPSSPTTANWRAIKAAYMSVIYGGGGQASATRNALVQKLSKLTDPVARLSAVEAIDELAPQGDTAAADALDKIVASDKAAGDSNLLAGDDAVAKVALRLRARAGQ